MTWALILVAFQLMAYSSYLLCVADPKLKLSCAKHDVNFFQDVFKIFFFKEFFRAKKFDKYLFFAIIPLKWFYRIAVLNIKEELYRINNVELDFLVIKLHGQFLLVDIYKDTTCWQNGHPKMIGTSQSAS